MKRLLDGLKKFQNKIFPEERELFERLASHQSPEALLITCADSRIVPEMITQTKPGDLFICRNAGNIVPAYGGEVLGGVSATIEYAVLALNVKDIIVCGHSDCGAMKALMHPEKLAGMSNVSAWLRHAEGARFVVQENCKDLEEHECVARLVEENVISQLQNLRTHPSVASRLIKGSLHLHGWVYSIETGVVEHLDQASRQFAPLGIAEPVESVLAGAV